MEEAKKWNMSPNETQTSFDVVNLHPSVLIGEAVIIEILNNDIYDLRKRKKLTLTDIQKLIELCLSTNCFTFDNCVRAYFGKRRSDWFSINGCDIRSFPTAFRR